MAWNEELQAWATPADTGSKTAQSVRYTVTEHSGTWDAKREVLVSKRGARLIAAAIRLAKRI